MKKAALASSLGVAIFLAGIAYGFVLHKWKVFPYNLARTAYRLVVPAQQEDPYGPWSIGIYEGSTPFELADPASLSNPVLTGRDVTDVDATFVADPFLVAEAGQYYMFFEVLNRTTNQGDIGYAESQDALNWTYKKIVLDEEFHLSFPYVFEGADGYYLIPESHTDVSVRLYKAVSFPEQWEYVKTLISGYRYVDPAILRYNDKWWLFVTTPDSDVLNIYYSSDLLGSWTAHPLNPVVKLNNHVARPGGRVIIDAGRIYRFTQDDYPRYGIQVFAFEITELTETTYAEQIVSENPVVTASGEGWNATGMHHVDPLKVGDRWIAVVDGQDR